MPCRHALSSWTNSCSLRVATRCGQGDGLRILNQVSLEESGLVLNAPYGARCFLTLRNVLVEDALTPGS